MRQVIRTKLLILVVAGVMAGSLPPARAADLSFAQWVVAAPDRWQEDRDKDQRRAPAELLAFSGVRPGDRVADIGAGGGYTTELLARVVGCRGRVYAQNTPYILEQFVKDGFDRRLAKSVMAPVSHFARPFDDPLPEEVGNLDAVFMVLIYHDALVAKADPAALNRAIFNALRPGGVFIVVDHNAKAGSGATEIGTLHRIEADYLKQQVEAAGFQLVEEGDFLRNPDDPREEHFRKLAIDTDKFVFKFAKPAE